MLVVAITARAQTQSGALPPIIDLLLHQSDCQAIGANRLEKTLDALTKDCLNHIFIAAHRGGKDTDDEDQIPGNSIANIDNALNKGYDIFESDIEIIKNNTPNDSSDDVLVVFHDDFFNDLTNFDELYPNPEATMTSNLLDEQSLSFAQSLFLTYDNGGVSNQRIPTLEEFLTAIKGKMLVKFDLKSGTFSASVIRKILDTVVATDTVDQVFIRAGTSALEVAKTYESTSGTSVPYTRIMMPRYNEKPDVAAIQNLGNNYSVRAISIPALSNVDAALVAAAKEASILIEIHETQGVSDQQREADYQTAIDLGIRQFHSFKPSKLKSFLEANDYRSF
jgi:glycerophosphoryl diester phosphodiesterase